MDLMAHITISTNGGINNPKLVQALRSCLGGSMAFIVDALRVGSPLFDEDLFSGPREEQFARVRLLLTVLGNAQVQVAVWEDGRSICVQSLLNIMQSSDDSMAAFDTLGNLGHQP